MNRFLFLWVLALASPSFGQIVLEIDTDRPGTHYLRVDVSAAGGVSVSEVPVVRIGSDDLPPSDPPGGGDSNLLTVARDHAARLNDPTTASSLAVTFDTLASSIAAGRLSLQDATGATKQSVDVVLSASGGRDRWQSWRGAVSRELAKLGQDGELGSPAQYASAYRTIAEGLRAAGGGVAPAIDPTVIVDLIAAITSRDWVAIISAILAVVQSFRG